MVNFSNDGASSGSSCLPGQPGFPCMTGVGAAATVTFAQNGDIWANIYAYSPDEQLVSCCSSNVTPNALNSLSVKADLASNTLTPIIPSALVIKVLSSPGSTLCNSATAGTLQSTDALIPGLLSWGTMIHALPVTGTPATTYGVTETAFSRGVLSRAKIYTHDPAWRVYPGQRFGLWHLQIL